MKPYEFRTANGHILLLGTVNPLRIQAVRDAAERELRQRHLYFDPPTYKVETAVEGETVEYTHVVDKAAGVNTLLDDDPAKQAANEKAWSAYIAGLGRLNTLQGQYLTELVFAEGVDVSRNPDYPDGDWVRVDARLHMSPPAEEPGRKLHYIQYQCLSGTDELALLITTLTSMATTGKVDEDRIASAMSTFRDQQERRADGAAEGEAGRLDGQPAAGSVPDSPDLAPDA